VVRRGLVIVILGLERGWGGEGKERENNGVGKYSIFLGRVAVAEAERGRDTDIGFGH